jgi:dienelactone hydrolase
LAIIIGEKDERVMSACTSLASHPAIRVRVLPDAYHAFDSPETHGKHDLGGTLMLYSAAATKKAQEIIREFFAKHLRE